MTILLDQLPPYVTEALHQKAQQEGRSVQEVATDAIVRGLDVKKRDLSRFRGTWVEDPAFDEAIKAFERVEGETEL